ncbi:MAG: hypothetical protein JXR66_02315 [Bacteroidales bacterium]|nr:hypothetical protein [Bacteroidales bacterium]MBN2632360.1 hypothetical protein [Bacteroidales bacterium]
MNKWLLLIVPLLLAGCREEVQDTYLTPEKASAYFKKVESVCNRDNGKLWGRNLYGPVMYVDRASRKIIANQSDQQGLLKSREGIYTGTYPRELLVNNVAVNYGGTLFAMAPLPMQEDEYRIINRAVHALFHCYQESIGYTSSGFRRNHLDDKNARLWIKLEWKALRKAVTTEGEAQRVALRDALVFKGSKRELYPGFTGDEIKFENYEGLAAFTYILLSTNSSEENQRRLLEFLDRTYSMPSFTRSYGALTGALYANLLYRKGFDFTTIRSENIDLSREIINLYDIQLPQVCRDVAGSIALNYDLSAIQEEEDRRIEEIKSRLHRLTSTFTEKPVVIFELESPYFDFEDADVHPMDTLGTLYSAIRVSDNWGKLTVEKGGCLVSNNLKYVRITSKGYKADRNRFEGEGWHLVINSGWELAPMNENYLVRKMIP